MPAHPDQIFAIKTRISENLQDLFVYCVSLYNFWTWAMQGTYKYFNGWEIYDWIDFVWTMTWQLGSMYLLYRRIKYIQWKESQKQDKEATSEEELVVDGEQMRKLGLWDKLIDFFKSLVK